MIILSVSLLLMIGCAVERTIVAPLRKRPAWEVKVIMIALGLALFLDSAYQIGFGARMKSLAPIVPGTSTIGLVVISHQELRKKTKNK